ncbi:MAG: tetratricopeptide repeat protein [Planctomycetes bacterium]|nr:tetratricopeptide repeat protein [Planctomycetota bacterium]
MSETDRGDAAPLPTPSPSPDRDNLFGKTLIREGVLDEEQIRTAVRTQKQMAAQGISLRLGEVLVRQGLLTADQVRQFLQLAGKQLLHCPKCGRNFNVKNWRPEREVFCPTCSVHLVPPHSDLTIDAHETHDSMPSVRVPDDARDRQGKRFGRYRLLEELGRGGMGVVWKAWDTQLKRMVALKQILHEDRGDSSDVARFMREARLAAKLRHPHIVSVYDVGMEEGHHFFTTEFIAGQSLDRLMGVREGAARRKPVSVKQALLWVKTAADALAYAHAQGVVHRDVKPGNFLIDGKGHLHVMDFGLAKEVDLEPHARRKGEALTMSGAILGTPQYMSPEQATGARGGVGPASDQFSLGVVLYELLTGRAPFQGQTLLQLLKRIERDEPARPSSVAPRLHRDVETLCLKALEKNPTRRYSTIADFASDLQRCLDGEPIEARPISAVGRLWRRAVKHRAAVIPVAAALVVVGGVVIGQSVSERSRRIRVAGQIADAQKCLARSDFRGANDLLLAAAESDPEQPEVPLLLEKARAGLQSVEERRRSETDLAKAGERKAVEESRSVKEKQQRRTQALGVLKTAEAIVKEASAYLYRTGPLDPMRKDILVAMPAFDEALRIDPDLADAYWAKGRANELLFDKTEAMKNYDAALERDPEFALALADRARLHVDAWEEAFLTNRSRNRETEEPNAHLRRAAADLERFLKKSSLLSGRMRIEACLVEAVWPITQSNPAGAEELCDRYLREFGESTLGVEVFYRLKGMTQSMRNPKEAVQSLTKALGIRPNYPEALQLRGTIHDYFGDLDAAVADYSATLKMHPRSAYALSVRAFARVRMGDEQGALEDETEWIRVSPEDPHSWYARSVGRYRTGDVRGALADLDECLKRDPRRVQALTNRSAARADTGDFAGALEDLNLALEIDPRCVIALLNRGAVRRDRREFNLAIADFTEVLRLDPRSADAHLERGRVYYEQGDYSRAVSDYGEALKFKHGDIDLLYERGRSLLELGEFDRALADFEEGVRLDPNRSELHFGVGAARQGKGDLDGALAGYDKALSLAGSASPLHPRIEEARRAVLSARAAGIAPPAGGKTPESPGEPPGGEPDPARSAEHDRRLLDLRRKAARGYFEIAEGCVSRKCFGVAQAYLALTLAHDSDHEKARKRSGQRRSGTGWERDPKAKIVTTDQVTDDVAYQVRETAQEKKRIVDQSVAADLVSLAEWCAGAALPSVAASDFTRALDYDPDNAKARQALGFLRVGERWVSSGVKEADEAMAAELRAAEEGEIVNEPTAVEKGAMVHLSKRRSKHFLVQGDANQEQIKRHVRLAETVYARFLHDFGVTEERLGRDYEVIHLATEADHRNYVDTLTDLSPERKEWIKKHATGYLSQQRCEWFDRDGKEEEDATIHAVAHMLLSKVSGLRWCGSPWLWEGVAFFYSNSLLGTATSCCMGWEQVSGAVGFGGGDTTVWKERMREIVVKGEDADIFGVLNGSLDTVNRPQMGKAWSLVDFFLAVPSRQQRFLDFLRRLSQGTEQEKALQEAFQWNYGQLDDEWRAYVRTHY